MQQRCEHLRSDNLSGTHCQLTGASATPDCRAPREAGTDGDELRCVPSLSLLYARGERDFLANLDRLTREAVMATAPKVRARMGSATKSEASKVPEQSGGIHLGNMTAKELLALAAKAREQAKLKAREEKQASRILPALEQEKERLEARLDRVEQALEEARAGKPVDLKALGVKIGRGGATKPRSAAQQAVLEKARAKANPGARAWTPEDLETLRRLREDEALTFGEIAERLGRSKNACNATYYSKAKSKGAA